MNFKDIIKTSVLESFSSDISVRRICIVMGLTLILGVYIFMVYRVAVKNEFYSKDFNRSLVLMALVTAGIVLAIQSNLVISLGMVGALSIVRYRTAIKSPLDLFFLFWSISIGIVCGANLFVLACIMCIVVTCALFFLEKLEAPMRLGLLVIRCDDLKAAHNALRIVEDCCTYSRIKNKSVNKTSVEIVIEFKVKKEDELEEKLSKEDNVKSFSFLSYDRETRI